MSRGLINTILSALLLLIAAVNLADGITENKPVIEGLLYVGLFVILACSVFLFRNKITPKISAAIVFVLSLLTILYGSYDNLSGVGLLFAAVAIVRSKKIRMNQVVITASFTLTVISVIYVSVSNGWSIPDIIGFLGGYAFIFALLWTVCIHKVKPPPLSKSDRLAVDTLILVIKGLSYTEIANNWGVTPDAISKRLERLRLKRGARSNEDLVLIMSRNGQIDIK